MKTIAWMLLVLTASAAPGAKALPAPEADEAYRQISVLTRALEQVRRHYVDAEQVGYERLLQGALRGMMQTLDEHSQYLDPEDHVALRDEAAGEFGGVGIVVGLRGGRLVVIAPLEDTPASRAGLLPGDRIVEINGEGTEDWALNDAARRLRGPPGTGVEIRVDRPDHPGGVSFRMVRAVIDSASVRDERMLEEGIGYVRVLQFSEKTAGRLESSLDRLEAQGMRALVLDLRNNPGGLLPSAVEVSQLFLPSGALIVTTEGRDPEACTRWTARRRRPKRYPLALLINAGSASASEIVAGALQDHGRAVLVGERTFGKGSVQSVIPIEAGAALRLTTAKYLTPSRRVIQGEGIEPDLSAPMSPETLQAIYRSRVEGSGGEAPPDIQRDRAAEALRAALLQHARR